MANLNFVESNHLRTVTELLGPSRRALLAVAYWGQGSSKRIESSKLVPSQTYIVCDLESGACNPGEIRKLWKAKYQIRSLNHLHSKVYWTPNAALVSSANFSADGLGFEGQETQSNIEAGIITKNPKVLSEIRAWFRQVVWENAKRIDEKSLSRADQLWRHRRSVVHFNTANSKKKIRFVEKITADSGAFDGHNIFVCTYSDGLSNAAKKKLSAAKRERRNSRLEANENFKFGRRKPRADDYLIIVYDNGKKYRFQGLEKIVSDDPEYAIRGGYIHLSVPVGNILGLMFGSQDRRLIEKKCNEFVKGRKARDLSIHVSRLFDGA